MPKIVKLRFLRGGFALALASVCMFSSASFASPLLTVNTQTTSDVVSFANNSDFAGADLINDVVLGISGGTGATQSGHIDLVSLGRGFAFTSSVNVAIATSAGGASQIPYQWTLTNSHSGYVEYSYDAPASPSNSASESFLGLVIDPTTRLIGLQIRVQDPVFLGPNGSNGLQLVLPTGWGSVVTTATALSTQIISLNSSWTIDTSNDPSGFYDDSSNTYLTITNSGNAPSNLSLVLWGDTLAPAALPIPEPATMAGLGLGLLILIQGTRPRAPHLKK